MDMLFKNQRQGISFLGRRFVYILCLLSFLIPGCDLLDHLENEVVIVIGSRQITTDELERDLEFINSGIDEMDRQQKKIRDKQIEQIIDHYLIMEYARENGIVISEKELKKALKDIKAGYSENAFQDALLRGYLDFEEWKGRLKEQILVNKVLKKVTENVDPPSYKDIKRYFAVNKSEFRVPQMLSFRQIVTRTKNEAANLLKRLKNGEKMAELARQYSIGPEGENGGKVGWVARKHLEESMERALFSLPQGKISNVVKSPYGYHIFKVLSVQPGGMMRLPEVFRKIESKLVSQRRKVFCRKWLQELRSRFDVKVDRNLLNKLELS